jgi:hypothetical protein
MHTDRRGHTCRQKCGAKGSGEVKIQAGKKKPVIRDE